MMCFLNVLSLSHTCVFWHLSPTKYHESKPVPVCLYYLDLETGLRNSWRVLEICFELLVIMLWRTTGCWGMSTSISPTEIMAELCSFPLRKIVVCKAWVLSMFTVTTVLSNLKESFILQSSEIQFRFLKNIYFLKISLMKKC